MQAESSTFNIMEKKNEAICSFIMKELPILLENHEKLKQIKCHNKNHGCYVCIKDGCQHYPFMCNDENCPCRQHHKDCMKIELLHVLQKLQKKVINLEKLVQQHNQTVDQFMEQMTTQATKVKNLFKTYVTMKSKEIQFSFQEHQIVKKIQQNNVQNLKGNDFFKISSQLQLNKKNQNAHELIKEIKGELTKWKHMENKMMEQFEKIKHVYKIYEHDSDFYKVESESLESSKIVKNPQEVKNIRDFFDKKIKHFQLLYRASQNQFKVSAFHKDCDGVPNTLVLIETQFDKIIGAYSPLKWRNSKNQQFLADSTGSTFIFSLTNNQKLKQKDLGVGIWHYPHYGPMFGNMTDCDLGLSQSANQNQGSFGDFNYCFFNQNYKNRNHYTHKRFTGNSNNSPNFLAKQWQVWKIVFQQQ